MALEIEDDNTLDMTADLSMADPDEELSFQDGEDSDFVSEDDEPQSPVLLETKSKAQPKTFSLQARRAIEDHIERRRLRKELDYLFDDEFANPEDTQK